LSRSGPETPEFTQEAGLAGWHEYWISTARERWLRKRIRRRHFAVDVDLRGIRALDYAPAVYQSCAFQRSDDEQD